MFRTRLISGIVLLAFVGLFFYTGGLSLLTLCLLISLIAEKELCGVFDTEKTPFSKIAYMATALYYAALPSRNSLVFCMAAAVFTLLIMCFVLVRKYPQYQFRQAALSYTSMIYAGITVSCIYLTRSLENGKLMVWLILIIAWGSDTLAYCTGRLIGKHKAFPVLSPAKSVEGCIGGILGAALLGAAYAAALGLNIAAVTAVCAIGSVLAQLGDLSASMIKREYGIKDYGTLIPGHGGVMDRFDSVIFTAPAVYFILLLIQGTIR